MEFASWEDFVWHFLTVHYVGTGVALFFAYLYLIKDKNWRTGVGPFALVLLFLVLPLYWMGHKGEIGQQKSDAIRQQCMALYNSIYGSRPLPPHAIEDPEFRINFLVTCQMKLRKAQGLDD